MERGKWAHFLDPNGTGQGLSICRQIMNGFGGKIELLECKPSIINIHIPIKGLPAAHTSIFRISLPEAFK
jgi:signal transduction histidine kinase